MEFENVPEAREGVHDNPPPSPVTSPQSPPREPKPEFQLHIVDRVGNLPVVISVVDQLGALYGYTKEANSLVRYGLETAESGLKRTTAMAVPVVNKFGKPVSMLDAFAVSQLEKLEEHVPIITKPTPDVIDGAKHLYSNTVGPTVDRLASVTKYGVDSVSSVKDMGVNMRVTDYGCQKINQMGNTWAGQYTHQKLEQAITDCEAYMDYLLPENDDKVQEQGEPAEDGAKVKLENGAEGKEQGKAADVPEKDAKEESKVPRHELDDGVPRGSTPVDTLIRARQLSWKAGSRVYNRGKAGVQKVMMRSKEAIQKLSYTVDLIEYAKNLDGGKEALQNGLVRSRDKIWNVWEQVTESPEAAVNRQRANEGKPRSRIEAIEARLIATARTITFTIKNTLDSLPTIRFFMPKTIRNAIDTIRAKINELFTAFTEIGLVSRISRMTIASVQSLINTTRNMINAVLTQLSLKAYRLPTPNDKAIEERRAGEEGSEAGDYKTPAATPVTSPVTSPVASPHASAETSPEKIEPPAPQDPAKEADPTDDPKPLEPLAEDPNEGEETKADLKAPVEEN